MMRSLIDNASKVNKASLKPGSIDSTARVESALALSGSFATLLLLLSKRENDSGRRFESSRFQTDIPRRSLCINGTRA